MRSPAGDVGAFVAVVLLLGFLVSPMGTVGFVLAAVGVTFTIKRGVPALRGRLDGNQHSLRFPGLGTLDLRFSAR